MSDIGSQGGTQVVITGRGKLDQEIRCPGPVIGFGAENRAQETEAGRRIRMVMGDVVKPAFGRGEADGTMFLAVEIMDNACSNDGDKNDGHGLFHELKIIPQPTFAVNTHARHAKRIRFLPLIK